MRFFYALMLVISLVACHSSDSRVYTLEQITIIKKSVKSQRLVVDYDVSLESMYASPGARLEYDGDDLVVSIVRCLVGSECSVDVLSTTADGHYQIVIPLPRGAVYLGDNNVITLYPLQ